MGVDKYALPLPFVKTDIANADGTLIAVQATTNDYVMPSGGSVIGFSASPNGTLTTGTLQFQPRIDGSLCPMFPASASLHTNQGTASYMQEAGKANYTFTAGQKVGVNYDASDTIEPETMDGSFLLFVLLEGVRY
jgi:hypothetical protein